METITYNEFIRRRNNGELFYIIDLRENEAYKKGHLRGSVNIPENAWENIDIGENTNLVQIMSNISRRGFNILLYCNKGNFSMLLAKRLSDFGISAISLFGGIDEIKRITDAVNNKK